MRTIAIKFIQTGCAALLVMLYSCNNFSSNTTNKTGVFTDSRDGQTYKWVKIGEQVWMAENLNYTKNNAFQRHITDDKEWENNNKYDGFCYYDNNANYGKVYGVLYQWEAAKNACPDGWHLPSDEEWSQLENYLQVNGYSYDGVIGNDYFAKSLASEKGWSISNRQGVVGSNDFSNFRNKTGFSALPSGHRYYSGMFMNLGDQSHWWSSTAKDNYKSRSRFLWHLSSVVIPNNDSKLAGFSIRCIKNEE
jgi:uncharacterized protein (TIGR02145 family)